MLGAEELSKSLGVKVPTDLPFVAYETSNRLTNRGKKKWDSVNRTPLRLDSRHVQTLSFDCHGDPVPGKCCRPDRQRRLLWKNCRRPPKNRQRSGLFQGDGASRGKIGIPPIRATGFAGSYSPDLRCLTIVRCDPTPANGKYVNSMWEQQKDPYAGDLINAYNDGSPAPGQPPLGPFYELETSSPGAELAPGQSLTHRQITVHFTGESKQLNPIATQTLGVSLEKIRDAFDGSGN